MSSKIHCLAYFVSHPIQYQAPLLKKLSEQKDIDLNVFFLADISKHNYLDQGFNQAINWDTPLLEGYQYLFLDSELNNAEFSLFNPRVSLKSVSSALKAKKWDAIWFHGYNNLALLYAIWSTVKSKTPVFFRCDSTLNSSKPRFAKDAFIKWLVRNSSALLWSSSDNKDYYIHYGAKENQLYFSPHAVDNDYFQSFIKTHNQASNSPREKCVLLFASKLIKRKNAPLLLDAFRNLDPAIQMQAELWFVGDGEEKALLEKNIKQYGLEDNVFILGFKNQSEMPVVLSQCDVFILPSEKEPFGLIINEAMNLGKAIITTNEVGAARDLVEHQVNGWIIPTGDTVKLTQALSEAIQDKQKLQEMGEKSLAKINQWSFTEDVEGILTALSFSAKRD